jgi:hypothetical protein
VYEVMVAECSKSDSFVCQGVKTRKELGTGFIAIFILMISYEGPGGHWPED